MLDKWDFIPLIVTLIHLALCPYTKVEESFNMQAVHDIITYRYDLEVSTRQKYDHFQFPGVVPRTFVGALGLGYLTFPLYWVCLEAGFTKACGIYIARGALAILNVAALAVLRRAVTKVFGEDTGFGLYLVVSCQFHLPFYMSRTLPNTYALCLCTLSFAYWLLGKQQVALALVTFGGVCFRCDLVLLALPMGVWLLVSKPGELANTILYPLLALVVGIGLSMSIDSFFWRRLVWPELEVLLFNTVENRSADWGTAPWHWYWTSALPRVLMGEVLLVACGLFLRPVGKKWVDQRVSSIGFLVFAYIGLYSFLPHKELRFLFPILPGLAILAATGLIKLYFSYRTKCVYKSDTLNFSLLALAASALLFTSLGSAFALYISSYNYPGGVAITEFSTHYAELRRQDPAMPLPYVHIDVMPAMTGVCRFLEYMPDWRYSKTENLTDFSEFTHLLSPHRDIPGFTPIFFPIKGYETFLIRKRRLILRDKIFIHQRDDIQFRYEPSEDSTCRHS